MKKGGSKLLTHIAVMVIIFGVAVGVTFSWYPRTSVTYQDTGNVIEYSQSGNINGDGATIATYLGTNTNGNIVYDSSAATGLTAQPGETIYFKTVITDVSNSTGNSRVSLYLEKVTFSQAVKDYIHFGITSPEKTYKPLQTVNIGDYSVCLEDHVILPKQSAKTVYWFVYVDPALTTQADLNLGTMHLVYN